MNMNERLSTVGIDNEMIPVKGRVVRTNWNTIFLYFHVWIYIFIRPDRRRRNFSGKT